MKNTPFTGSYWVVPGLLLAGYYPGSEDKGEAEEKLNALLDHGVRHIINLMEPHEINRAGRPFVPYEDDLVRIASARGFKVKVERFPIRDMGVPSRNAMVMILDSIDKRAGEKIPVYVHCLGGRGRTGTVVGCYLVRHGYAQGEKVLDMIDNLRSRTEDRYSASPDSEVQRDMVISWVRWE